MRISGFFNPSNQMLEFKNQHQDASPDQ